MPGSNSRNRRRGSGAKGGQTFQEQLGIVNSNLKRAGDAVGDFVEKATPVVVEGWNKFISLDPQVEYNPNRFGGSAQTSEENPPAQSRMGGLPADYKETEAAAFAQAAEHQRTFDGPKNDDPPDADGDKPSSGKGTEGGTTASADGEKAPNLLKDFRRGKHITPQTGEKFAPAFGKSQLRYPYESTQSNQDYIRFNLYKYERAKGSNNFTKEENRDRIGEGKFFSSGIGDETVALKNLLGSILLPVPSAVSDSNSVQYGSSNLNAFAGQAFQMGLNVTGADSLTEAGQAISDGLRDFSNLSADNRNLIRNKLVASAVNQFGANLDINQVLARSSGEIINPNMELLFNAPTLRQFKFQFKFTPRFEQETLEVKRIIKAFKKNMSAKGGRTGAVLQSPNIFQLQYVKGNGRPQGFLHEFKLCALQTVSVNYTGDGNYATYYDGTPVSMTMELAFQELSPVYNEDYDLRNNRDGVGF